jgi:transcriptional regulator with XRE-family HTH domain
MESSEKILAENLKKRRKAAKLSQKELARLAGISEITLNRIEVMKQKPEDATLIEIARVLKCTKEDLLGVGMPSPLPPTPGAAELAELLTDARRELARERLQSQDNAVRADALNQENQVLKEAKARWDQTAQEAANRILELEEENEMLKGPFSEVSAALKEFPELMDAFRSLIDSQRRSSPQKKGKSS